MNKMTGRELVEMFLNKVSGIEKIVKHLTDETDIEQWIEHGNLTYKSKPLSKKERFYIWAFILAILEEEREVK